MENPIKIIALGVLSLILVIATFFGTSWLWKNYKVWGREQDGRAELAEAEWTRKIAIEEAKARQESAVLDAQAEVERAKGVAEANRIIGEGLRGNDDYLRYLWINSTKGQQVIYIPTEAGLPILEAGKRK